MKTSVDGHLPSQGWSQPQPKDGHPPEGSVLQTWNLTLSLNSQNYIQMTTVMDGHLNLTKLKKLILVANCHGWLATISRMVTHQPMDGHPPEGSILQTLHLLLRLKSQS